MKHQVYSDTATADSDKTIAYNDGASSPRLMSLRIEYTATATAGTRTVEVRFLDGTGDIVYATEIVYDIVASDVIIVNLSPGGPLLTPVDQGDEGSQHIAAGLPEGGSIQVLDTAAIAAAADTMILHAIVAYE